MAPSDVEIVLLKQLASCLRTPIALLGADGTLVYFNEPAEAIFGRRFEEMGGLGRAEWQAMLEPSDAAGHPLPPDERPLVVALERRVPAHRRAFVRVGSLLLAGRAGAEDPAAADGRREIAVTGIPLEAVGGRFLGALGLFWQPDTGLARALEPPVGASGCPGPIAVETILTRRVATTLATPVFLVDRQGELLYFNAAAEPILGHRFVEDGLGSSEQLYAAFRPRTAEGNPIAPEEHPLTIARTQGRPVHRGCWIDGLDGKARQIAVTAIPLIGQSDRLVGAFGLFWEARP